MDARTIKRWWALGGVTLAILAIGLDSTVLNVALPTLAASLHASESQLQWFVAAYTLALATAMLPSGFMGDRYGRRRVLIVALALFGTGSVACALSPSPEAFIAARALLGFAGAAIVVMSLATLTVLFSEQERPRAVGIWAAANFLALPVGPILGGWMLTHFWWGWVFLLNVPVTVVGLVAVVTLVPESRSAERPALDVVGVVTSTGGVAALTYGLIQAGENGWGSSGSIGLIAAGFLALALFTGWETRLTRGPHGQPLVDISLFTSRSFTWGVILAGLGIFGLFGALFSLPQYFQAVLGANPQGAGLRLVPLIAGMLAGALPADRVAARVGRRATVAVGFAVLALSMGAGSSMTVSSGDAFIAAWTFAVGLGAGLSLATASSAALSELSANRSGVGSALMQAVQKLGPAFAAAILGSVINSAYRAQLHLTGISAAAAGAAQKSVFAGIAVAQQLHSSGLLAAVRGAFVTSMDNALIVSAGIAATGTALALAFLPRRGPATPNAADAGSGARLVA